MNIIEKYTVRTFAVPFISTLIIFIFLHIVIDLFNYLDEILKAKTSIAVLVHYYLAFTPIIFTRVLPFATLIATLYALMILNKSNEITAMKACGISTYRIIRPFLFIGILLTLVSFIVNDRVVPKSTQAVERLKETRIKQRRQKTGPLEEVTLYGAKNRMFYIRNFYLQDKVMKEIIILEHDNQNRIKRKIISKHAKWHHGNEWIFYDGTIINYIAGKIRGALLPFQKKVIDIGEIPESFASETTRAEFMNYQEIREYIKRFSHGCKSTIQGLLVEFYCKFSFPCINFIVVLIGILFAFTIQGRSGGWFGVAIGIIIGFIYYAVMGISIAMGKGGMLPPLLAAWLANIIFGTASILLLAKIRT